MTLQGIDEVLKETGLVKFPVPPEKKVTEMPGIRVFSHRFPSANTRSITILYRRLEEEERKWGDQREKWKIRGWGIDLPVPPELRELRETRDSLHGLRLVLEATRASEMDPGKKRAQMDVLTLTMINLARIKLGKIPLPMPKIGRAFRGD